MLSLSRELARKPGHRINKFLRLNHKKNERHRAKPGLARLEKTLPTSSLIEQPRDIDNPYCHKHLHFYPRFLQKRLLVDAESAQKRAGLPPLVGRRFPRFMTVVEPDMVKPVLSNMKAKLNHIHKISISYSPWQSGSETAFEFWRRITSMEVRTTNVKCVIESSVKNDDQPDTVVITYYDDETMIFETNNMSIDEVWYHFQVANIGRTEIATEAAAGSVF